MKILNNLTAISLLLSGAYCTWLESEQDITPQIILNGDYGFWQDMIFTINGYYACGASVRASPNDGSDSSSINGLQLKVCSANDWSDQYDLMIEEGFDGDWTDFTDCSEGNYLAGAQVQYYETRSRYYDDLGMSGLRIICRNPAYVDYDVDETYESTPFEKKLVYQDPNLDNHWRDPEAHATKFIAGAQAKFLSNQGSSVDDRGMTGLQVYYYTFFSIEPLTPPTPPVPPPEGDTEVSENLNLQWFDAQLADAAADIVPVPGPSSRRLEAHVSLDKVIYRPSDVMFIEAYIVDAFEKTPVALDPEDAFFENFFYNIVIFDPQDTQIASLVSQAQDSTVSFTFKLSSEQAGGEYKIKVFNSATPSIIKLFRVRDYDRDELVVQATTSLDTYFPGYQVNGKIKATRADGAPFEEDPTFDYEVLFESSTISEQAQTMNSQGEGYFSFSIPEDTLKTVATISFTVFSGEITQIYSKVVIIGQPQSVVIDFVPETGILVNGVQNKIYFHAFTNEARTDIVDFEGGSIIEVGSDESETTLNEGEIDTQHKGKGVFLLTPQADATYFLTVAFGSSDPIRVAVNPQSNLMMVDFQYDVAFTIENEHKVLDNEDNLDIKFRTNSLASHDDTFYLNIQHKEQILYSTQLQFNPNSETTLSIPNAGFNLINGGVLTLNLFKVVSVIVDYDPESETEGEEPPVLPPIWEWQEPRGEILFMLKPSDHLVVEIETNQDTYAPADQVDVTVTVKDKSTGEVVTDVQTYVSLRVTDDSVFAKIEEKKQPPSFASQVYLEHEVFNNDFQLYYAGEYIEHLFSQEEATSLNLNVELLLGVQLWRHGKFYLPYIEQLFTNYDNLPEEEQIMLQNIYGYALEQQREVPEEDIDFDGGEFPFPPPQPLDPVFPEEAVPDAPQDDGAPGDEPAEQGQNQEEEDIPGDFMQGIPQHTRSYSHQLREDFDISERIDFTETVLYVTAGNTVNGVFSASFMLSDLITKFRITANSFDSTGRIGYARSDFQVQKAFFVNFELPSSFVLDDILNIPVSINNLLNEQATVALSSEFGSSAASGVFDQISVLLDPQSSQVVTLTVTADAMSDRFSLKVTGVATYTSSEITDSITQFSSVVPLGFPKEESQGGFIGTQEVQTEIPDQVSFSTTLPATLQEGSVKFEAKVFSSSFASLLEAIEALIRDPYGCFEQTSATTYPLVMGLSFLKASAPTDEIQALIIQAEQKLQAGYNKLVTFETAQDGYEWFGSTPAHEALTAYGLMQFVEMSQVTSLVNQDMVDRTRAYLLSRRDGNGGFSQSDQALDTFGRAPDDITNAYIVWALTSAGETDLDDEVTNLIEGADEMIANNEVDPYYMGLLAASLYNLGRDTEGDTYASEIVAFQQPDGSVTGAQTSITSSMGNNLVIETTSIAMIAWLDNQSTFSTNIEDAAQWLVESVSGAGAYGSTQATILALKALTKYMSSFIPINGSGDLILRVNSEVAQTISFDEDTTESIKFDISDYITNNPTLFEAGDSLEISLSIENYVSGNGEDFKLQYAFLLSYYDEVPQSTSSDLSLSVTPSFDEADLGGEDQIGSTFQYAIELENTNSEGFGMTVLIFRVPSCLEINFNLLETLKNNLVFDMYEVINSNTEIVMYWRQMSPNEVKSFNINFQQRYSGDQCQQQPHSAYQYYNDDQVVWTEIQ